MSLKNLAILLAILTCGFLVSGFVERKPGKPVFIIDRTGTRWNVTQAESLGFKADGFQYGIGKNAFTPLNNSHLKNEPEALKERSRIIGIKTETHSHAYSVDRLRYHEIANTHIGETPIAAGY